LVAYLRALDAWTILPGSPQNSEATSSIHSPSHPPSLTINEHWTGLLNTLEFWGLCRPPYTAYSCFSGVASKKQKFKRLLGGKSLPTKKIRALGAFNIAKQPRDCSKTLAVLH
jgi:hypothetical protein